MIGAALSDIGRLATLIGAITASVAFVSTTGWVTIGDWGTGNDDAASPAMLFAAGGVVAVTCCANTAEPDNNISACRSRENSPSFTR